MGKIGYKLDWSELKDAVNIYTNLVMGDWIKPIIERTKDVFLNEAVRICPVDTGKLRDSLKCEWEKTADGYRITLYTDVKYAGFVEYGTINIEVGTPDNPLPAVKQGKYMPFMRPALIVAEKFLIKEIKDYIEKVMEEL